MQVSDDPGDHSENNIVCDKLVFLHKKVRLQLGDEGLQFRNEDCSVRSPCTKMLNID